MQIAALFRPATSVCWNVFLACIPVVLGFGLAALIRAYNRQNKMVLLAIVPVALIWLVFLPNTCYLLSEWRHYLQPISETPIVSLANHDHGALFALLGSTLFYVSYSGIGMVSFVVSIWPVEHAIKSRLRMMWPIQAVFFWLCSLGVYLGLVKRNNSWDIFTSERIEELFGYVHDAFYSPELLIMITVFALLLWLIYLSFDIWMLGFQARFMGKRAH